MGETWLCFIVDILVNDDGVAVVSICIVCFSNNNSKNQAGRMLFEN